MTDPETPPDDATSGDADTSPDREQPEPHLVPPQSVPAVSAEELVDGELVDGEQPEPGQEDERRYPSTIGGAFYLLLLAVCSVGVGIVITGQWRLGIRVFGGALLLASVVRLALPSRDAGMLAVRHKLLDVLLLVALGAALVFLAGSIPDQPGP